MINLPPIDLATQAQIYFAVTSSICIFVFIVFAFRGWRRRQLRSKSVINPNYEPVARRPLTHGEKKLIFKLCILALIVSLIIQGPIFTILIQTTEAHFGYPIPLPTISIFALLGIYFLSQSRFPGSVSLHGETTIMASPSAIWEAIYPEDNTNFIRRSILKMKCADGTQKGLLLAYFSDRPCARCGLVVRPEDTPFNRSIEILESRPFSYLSIRSTPLPSKHSSNWHGAGTEVMEIKITMIESGMCRVRYHGVVKGATVLLALVAKLGNTAGDHLTDIKSRLEGSKNDTLFGTVDARIEAARRAQKFCVCHVD